MKTLTVITTTYNRDYCLHQVYESLTRQTNNDFIWMIVDDGSTDQTKKLVDGWIEEGKVEIEYYYKPNGGMHTARNLAFEKCKTLLNVIIDSDDWMTDDGVEKIITFWKIHGGELYAGIISNNIDTKGNLIGSPLPANVAACTSADLSDRYGVRGDKKIILRSDLAKKFPYPEFPGEKFYPASYKYRLLDQNYKMLLMDEATCVVDYNEDSMTFHKFEQYHSCCNGFAHYRNAMIQISTSKRFIAKQMVHYIAESKMARKKHYLLNSARRGYAIILWPAGIAYYFFLRYTRKKY